MKLEEAHDKLEKAFEEISEIINESYEHGQFNSPYFEQPFKKRFARKMDEEKLANK